MPVERLGGEDGALGVFDLMGAGQRYLQADVVTQPTDAIDGVA